MKLTQPEVELFYKLWYSLVWGVNERHKIIPSFTKPLYGTRISVSLERFMEIRNAMWDNPEWIDEFLDTHDDGAFTEQERGILMAWRRAFVRGKFLVMKHLAKYSVVMSYGEEPVRLYAVHGISDSLKEALPYPLPFPVELVLLPFQGKIIYDSLAGTYNIQFGSGIRASVKEQYAEIKGKYGILEALDGKTFEKKPAEPVVKPKKKLAKATTLPPPEDKAPPASARIPKELTGRYRDIALMIEAFCKDKQDDEFGELCLRALAKLCRKRPSPLLSGRVRTWACGIVYAIGANNFIFDKSQDIYMSATEIAEWFGLSKSTAASKSAEVTKLLGFSYGNTEFAMRHIIENNPMVWYLSVNGQLVDIRHMSREVQEIAYRRGLIPYIPADGQDG